MKIKLDISERFALLGILPEKGNYATQKVVGDLIEDIGFSVEELEKIEYKQEGDRGVWDPKKDPNKEFDFGKYESEVIADALKDLDEKDELERRHVSLYDKFVEAK